MQRGEGNAKCATPAPPTSESPRAPESLQPLEEEELTVQNFALVAVVRCMVGPAALYIPGLRRRSSLAALYATVAMALFAFGMARLASWRDARANGVTTGLTASPTR